MCLIKSNNKTGFRDCPKGLWPFIMVTMVINVIIVIMVIMVIMIIMVIMATMVR
jgi:hypothetical protein